MNPTDPSSTDPSSTDPSSTDPSSTDPSSTDPSSTDPSSSGSPVTIGEIAEFMRHLRALSTSMRLDPARDTSAERAAFAARKADLFTRIAAQRSDLTQHPDITPVPTARPGQESS